MTGAAFFSGNITNHIMKVLKFGGSSLATANYIRKVGDIVLNEARRSPLIVVVSAFEGVTNQLLECAQLAEKGDRRCEAAWRNIANRNQSVACDLLKRRSSAEVQSHLSVLFGDLHDALHGIQLLGHCPPRARDKT